MMTQTSLEAFLDIQDKLGNRQQTVLNALREIAPATNKQLAKHLGWEINSVTPRILELRKLGKVIRYPEYSYENGRKACQWRVK